MLRVLAAGACALLLSSAAASGQVRNSKDKPVPLPLPPAAPSESPARPNGAVPLPGSETRRRPSSDGRHLGLYRLVRSNETDTLLRVVEDSFRSVAESSQRYRSVAALPEPVSGKQGCGVSATCLAALGGAQDVDEVFAGELKPYKNGLTLKVVLVDTRTDRVLGSDDQVIESQTDQEVRARAESLACRLLAGGDCTGEALVDLDLPEMKLIVDDRPLDRAGKNPERLRLPVGAHTLRVVVGDRTSLQKPLLVTRAAAASPVLFAREREESIVLSSARDLPLGIDGRPALAPSLRPNTPARWNRPAGLAAVALGVVAGSVGIYEGLHGRSLIHGANASFDQRGAYLPGDLANIQSGKNAASAGNILLIAGGALAAAGLTLYFTF
ncbi:MAG: hypothetical protein E6J85_01015 [Deltaproteobacteria bacterium]|nr:MAG: hypothetical protein E6J85_01015 [Deltaproteobacteria bacterium]